MSTNTKNRRPKYSLEFKQDAVKLVTEKGYSREQAAKSLGISVSAMASWTKAETGTAEKPTVSLSDQQELVKLRNQIKQLEMEREILKKAMVFFAKEVK
jgi:transposase